MTKGSKHHICLWKNKVMQNRQDMRKTLLHFKKASYATGNVRWKVTGIYAFVIWQRRCSVQSSETIFRWCSTFFEGNHSTACSPIAQYLTLFKLKLTKLLLTEYAKELVHVDCMVVVRIGIMQDMIQGAGGLEYRVQIFQQRNLHAVFQPAWFIKFWGLLGWLVLNHQLKMPDILKQSTLFTFAWTNVECCCNCDANFSRTSIVVSNRPITVCDKCLLRQWQKFLQLETIRSSRTR